MGQSTMVNLSMDNARDMANTNLRMVESTLAPGTVAAILDLVLALGKVCCFYEVGFASSFRRFV